MQIGMVGLGRMGANMVRRLVKDGHELVVFDVNADAVKALQAAGCTIIVDDLGTPEYESLYQIGSSLDQAIQNAVAAIAASGCLTVVRGGVAQLAIGTSSKPVTATWPGTSTPYRRSA